MWPMIIYPREAWQTPRGGNESRRRETQPPKIRELFAIHEAVGHNEPVVSLQEI